MTKDVLITISGLHYDVQTPLSSEETDAVEVTCPALYYYKNGKHYVVYEEPVEGMPGTIKNTIKIQEDVMLEVIKSGITSTRMVFEKDRINVTPYTTPYGELLIGTHTTGFDVQVQEDQIDVYVHYALDVGGDKLADCDITMKIEARI